MLQPFPFSCVLSLLVLSSTLSVKAQLKQSLSSKKCSMIYRKGEQYTQTTYPQMLCNVLLINITHYFLLVTLSNVDKHVGIWILCELERRVIETRVYLRQLLHEKKKNNKMNEITTTSQQVIVLYWMNCCYKECVTSSSPPYCSSSAFFISSFVTRSSSNLYLKSEYPTKKKHEVHLQNL